VRATLGPDAIGAAAEPGGVAVTGDLGLVIRANLELGLANHVLVRAAEVKARAFPEFVRKAERIEWSRWLRPGVGRRILVTSKRSRLYHTEAIAQRLAGAIDAQVAPGDDDGAMVTVVARFIRDVCTLSVDTSGQPLHRRGWRQQTAKAPLREDLARALLLASGWDPATPLYDPMMGAGTILIEGACMARGLAPGLGRPFALEQTAMADVDALQAHRDRLTEAARDHAQAPIVGRDQMRGSLDAAIGNATRAGVLADLDLDVADLRTTPLPQGHPPGAVVSNPPYGKRVRPDAGLRALHVCFGERVRALGPGWTAALITPHRSLASATGLSLHSRAMTDHGGLKVELMIR
jgi:putative N6-adenine-specific DNA methylase